MASRGSLLLSVAGFVLLSPAYAAEQGSIKTPIPPGNDAIRLPVIDRQDIRFTKLSVAGESLQTRVASIAQDRYGFLWFGTDDGLYRYDGYNLKPYRHERDNPNSLSDDMVRVVYGDRAGILWVGTAYGGLNRLDPASDTFIHYRHDAAKRASLSDDGVASVFQDSGGVLWVGSNGGLDRLDPASGAFVHYVHNPQDARSLSNNLVTRILEDHSGNLWVTTVGGGVNRLDRNSGRFSSFRYPNPHVSPGDDSNEQLSRIAEDRSGVLWVGFRLGTLDPKTGSLTPYAVRSKEAHSEIVTNVRAIREDRDGVLWVGTHEGLLALDRKRERFVRYTMNPVNPHSLHNHDIVTLFEDAEGNMWVGTRTGVSWFNRKTAFTNRQHEVGNTQSLADNTIRAVHADSHGALWVGTTRGLQRIDLKTGRFTLYAHHSVDSHSLSNNYVTAIREDRLGTLWIGTGGGGLNRFEPSTGRFFAYRYRPDNLDGLSSDAVLSLLEDRGGVLWVATAAGLNRWDRRTGRFATYHHNREDSHSLSDDLVKTVFEDRAGNLWVGTNNGGLNRLDRRSHQFTAYRHNPRDPASLSHDRVNAIWEDRWGTLWIATQGGLNRMDQSQGTFTNFTRNDGLADGAVQAILEDDQGDLWLATNNGLSQFHPQTRTFRNYSESHGLAANALSPSGIEGSTRAPSGEMWFGSMNGLTSFYPNRLSANPYVPPVVITNLLLFNTPIRPGANPLLHKSIWEVDSLTLDPRQSIFTLEFAALSFTAPERNRYRYRLVGLEPDWNEVDSGRRLATYTSLPAANYVFQVQASNNDGVWNPKITTLPITILPPWWADWRFRSIMFLAIVALVLTIHRSRLRGSQQAGIRLEAQVAERTKELATAKDAAERSNRAKSTFLANMSHELRTPLNAILGFSARVRDDPGLSAEHRKDLEIVNRSGEHLLVLIDDVLDMAKIEAGGVVLEHTSFELDDLVRETVGMMRARSNDKGLELFLDISPTVPRFVRSDAGKFRQVLVNLISNAVKYTERGGVTVRVDATPMDDSRRILLALEVEDTGIGIAIEDQTRIFNVFVQAGRASARQGTGLGLTICRQFAEIMGGSIHVRSTLGKGSIFRVELPVDQAEEPEEAPKKEKLGEVVGLAPGQPEYRILVVEDTQENWLLLQRLLEEIGFQVQVAQDGAQAVEKFRTWQPHLIWMDLRLPVMNGLEASRRIREMESGSDVKIVAVTASAFASQREEVLAAGLDDFLRKPYRPREIFDSMSRNLGVQFIYRSSPRTAAGAMPATLRPENLAVLPEELREELENAVAKLDVKGITLIISRIAEQNPELGSMLAHLAGKLRYSPILDALEKCRDGYTEARV